MIPSTNLNNPCFELPQGGVAAPTRSLAERLFREKITLGWSLFTSLTLGAEGHYRLCGIPIHFQEKTGDNRCDPVVTHNSTTSKLKNLITLRKLFTFVHEMSHALMYKLLTQKNGEIYICSAFQGGGLCKGAHNNTSLPVWKENIWFAAGCIGTIAWGISLLIGALLIVDYNVDKDFFKDKFDINFAKNFTSAFLCFLATYAIVNNVVYAFSSFLDRDQGDFGKIATSSRPYHAYLALSGIITEFAISCYLVCAYYYYVLLRLCFVVDGDAPYFFIKRAEIFFFEYKDRLF